MPKKIRQIGKVGIKVLGVLAVFCITFWIVETLITQAQTFNGSAERLEQIANSYYENGQYDEAEQTYNTIIQQYPNSDYEFRAYKNLTILYIQSDNITSAEETTTALINNFSYNPGLAEALYSFTEKYECARKFEETKHVYQQIIQNCPNSLYADRARLGIAREEVMSLIASGSYTSAESALNKMVSDFTTHKDLPDTLYWIAETYKSSGNYDEAKNIYNHIIQNYYSNPYASKAELGIARADVLSLITSEKYDQAEEAINQLIADFSGYQDLAETLHSFTEKYEHACKFEEAKYVYQQIIQNCSDSSYTSKAMLGILREEVMSLIISEDYTVAQEAVYEMATDFSGHPDLPDTLYQIAERYRWSGKYEEAKNICQQIVQNYYDSQYADKAELGIARAEIMHLIATGNYDNAIKAIDEMVIDFSGYPDLPDTLYWIAEKYRWSDKYEEAKNIYQEIMQNYPDSPWAAKSRLGIARADILSLIVASDYEIVEEKLNGLITDFSEDPNLPDTLSQIAEKYGWLGKYEEAEYVNQLIVQIRSDAGESKLGISMAHVMSLIESGDYNDAQTAVDKLITDFPEDSALPYTLYLITLAFQEKERYEEAIKVVDIGIAKFTTAYPTIPNYYLKGLCYAQLNNQKEAKTNFQIAKMLAEEKIVKSPEEISASFAPEVYLYISYCYYQLGQYEEALRDCQKVIDEWPDYPYIHYAQLLKVGSYKGLLQSGVVTASEANSQIEKALLAVLEKQDVDNQSIERAMRELSELNLDYTDEK